MGHSYFAVILCVDDTTVAENGVFSLIWIGVKADTIDHKMVG
jgi:hypothetical protein